MGVVEAEAGGRGGVGVVLGEVVEVVDAVVLAVLRELVVLCRCVGGGAGAVVRVPGGGNGQRGGAGEESLFCAGGVSAVDAAHELVEGVGQVGFMLLAVVMVAALGVGADVLPGVVVERLVDVVAVP